MMMQQTLQEKLQPPGIQILICESRFSVCFCLRSFFFFLLHVVYVTNSREPIELILNKTSAFTPLYWAYLVAK
jgi:hypothetical protein